MKKVLLLFITFICSLTFVYAEEEYDQKWMNDNISIDVARHMIQVDDGLIVGGSSSDKVQLAKYDHNGQEIKTLKLDYEGIVSGFFEKDGKYYFIATNYEKDWEVYIYEITTDLTIVRSNNTGYHFEGVYEQADLKENKLYITSVDLDGLEGVYDDDDQYYAYFYIDLSNFKTGTGDNDKIKDYFSKEKGDLFTLLINGIPASIVRETDDLTIIGGRYSSQSNSEGFIQFYEKTDDLVSAYTNEDYISKNDINAPQLYTRIELLDDYIVAGGEERSSLDIFDYEGKKLHSIDYVELLYDSNHDRKHIQIEDMIYQKGRFSVAYQVCDLAYEQIVSCKSGIVVYQKKFKIETKTDGFGALVVSKESEYGAEEVAITVEPIEGYQIKEVKVTDKDGNVIIVEGDSFTMPFSDVVVEATFEPKNPETLTGAAIVGVGLLFILSLVAIIVNVRKAKDLM